MKKSNCLLILSLSIITFFSCKSSLIDRKNNLKIGNTEYTIFKFDPTEKYPLFKNSKPTNLSKEEVIQIEEIAGLKINEVISKHNTKLEKPDIYVRQYVPVINEKGEKEVWINIFCNSFNDSEWKKGVIDVADGGDCAFKLKVNIPKKEYYDLRINLYS